MADKARDGGRLRAVALHELEARGRVVEEVAHDDARPLGAARVLDRAGDAALQMELCSAERAALARENVEPRHTRDRRERLAAKAQRADGGKILRRAQLARRVA